jgi:hypothetical protein
MSNVLDQEKQHQIVTLGRLGWSLRRIEHTTGVRRETISAYLRSAGIAIRGHGQRPREWPPKAATPPEVSTDPHPTKSPGFALIADSPGEAKPATRGRRHEHWFRGDRECVPPASRRDLALRFALLPGKARDVSRRSGCAERARKGQSRLAARADEGEMPQNSFIPSKGRTSRSGGHPDARRKKSKSVSD